MSNVDDIMATCPLKHEIRVKFWEMFIRKLKKSPISYLTLYSPPLMDVKYLHHCKLIEEKDGVYSKVVGVGINADAEADTISKLDKRLELLLSGDINTLINGDKSNAIKVKQLAAKFPFDVINLDYTDTLHRYSMETELSPHMRAIENIFKKQQKGNAEEFVLFVTTDANAASYNPAFIADLKLSIDENIANTPNFKEKLIETCACGDAETYFARDIKNSFALSIVKFLLRFMSDYGFTICEGEFKWLIRDDDLHETEKNMLHIAFHVQKFQVPRAVKRANVGNRINNVEQKSVGFIKKKYHELKESKDRERLSRTYEVQIAQFNSKTFEIKVPEPK